MISKNPNADERQQYAAYLKEAEDAFHRLSIGASEVSVSIEGEAVTFNRVGINRLRSYIAELRRALGKSPAKNPGVKFQGVSFGSSRGGGLF